MPDTPLHLLVAALGGTIASTADGSGGVAPALSGAEIAALAAFAATHRSCDPPPDYVSSTGASIADWIRGVRRAARAGAEAKTLLLAPDGFSG